MILKSIKLINFRNYQNLEMEFSPEINFITGQNGSGKTNILEAVSIISNLKSFRNILDKDMIRWNNNSYYCSGEITGSEQARFEVGFSNENFKIKKKLKIDGNEIKKVSDYYGKLITVAFIPSDINIISGPPEIRRRYFDSVISKLYPEYIDDLNRLRQILNARNILLKKIKAGLTDLKQIDVWNRMFADKSYSIIKKRIEFINIFNSIFYNIYKNISGEIESPLITYNSTLNYISHEEIFNDILNNQRRDIRRGSTGIGPQRDDYLFCNSPGFNFMNYASQGQKRTAVISLKISEFEIIKKIREKKSIILVDDIFSELDEKRRNNMIEILIKEGQLIFTMVDNNRLRVSENYKTKSFLVNNGYVINSY